MAKKMIWVPVISAQHKAKICDYIASGEKQGATLLVDGRDFKVTGFEKGYFVEYNII